MRKSSYQRKTFIFEKHYRCLKCSISEKNEDIWVLNQIFFFFFISEYFHLWFLDVPFCKHANEKLIKRHQRVHLTMLTNICRSLSLCSLTLIIYMYLKQINYTVTYIHLSYYISYKLFICHKNVNNLGPYQFLTLVCADF